MVLSRIQAPSSRPCLITTFWPLWPQHPSSPPVHSAQATLAFQFFRLAIFFPAFGPLLDCTHCPESPFFSGPPPNNTHLSSGRSFPIPSVSLLILFHCSLHFCCSVPTIVCNYELTCVFLPFYTVYSKGKKSALPVSPLTRHLEPSRHSINNWMKERQGQGVSFLGSWRWCVPRSALASGIHRYKHQIPMTQMFSCLKKWLWWPLKDMTPTWCAESRTWVGPKFLHLERQDARCAPHVQVGWDSAGLNGHQIATNTYEEKRNLFSLSLHQSLSCIPYFKFPPSRKPSLVNSVFHYLFISSHLTTDLVW